MCAELVRLCYWWNASVVAPLSSVPVYNPDITALFHRPGTMPPLSTPRQFGETSPAGCCGSSVYLVASVVQADYRVWLPCRSWGTPRESLVCPIVRVGTIDVRAGGCGICITVLGAIVPASAFNGLSMANPNHSINGHSVHVPGAPLNFCDRAFLTATTPFARAPSFGFLRRFLPLPRALLAFYCFGGSRLSCSLPLVSLYLP